MKSLVSIAATVASLLSCISSETLLKAKAWKSNSAYPTASDFPEAELLKNKPNTAISFSGGGSRAFTGAMGYLAALRDLDLLKNVRYIGGISGGAWATLAFTYVQNVTDDEVFLGKIVQPADIKYEELKIMDPACARRLTDNEITKVAAEAYKNKIVDSVAEAYSYAVSQAYLEPVGVLPGLRFSWDSTTVEEIKQRNPELASVEFTIPVNRNRPFPIIGTTLVGPLSGAPFVPVTQNYSLLEITPLYVGTFQNLHVEFTYQGGVTNEVHTAHLGGAVEPFAFARLGGGAPSHGLPENATEGILEVPAPESFIDLQFAAGTTSYAPGTFFESIAVPSVAQNLSMQFNYWAPSDIAPTSETMMFGDGGSYENIILFSFLQRRVSKIVLFFLSSIPLLPYEDWDVDTDAEAYDQITDDLAAFFGAIDYPLQRFQNRTYEYEKNQVFSLDDFDRVAKGLQAAQASGRGIIASFNLTTIENAWWGIPAGLCVEITFSYLGRLPQWEALLSKEMYELAVPRENTTDLSVDIQDGPFAGFPHYPTAGGDVNAEQANLLADLTGWSVLQHADEFRHMLS